MVRLSGAVPRAFVLLSGLAVASSLDNFLQKPLQHLGDLIRSGKDDGVAVGKSGQRRPNVVFILTDDQDLHMGSLDYMPLTKKHITEQGTFFKRHFCTTAVCCPSRVSLLTGKLAHNTNVTDVTPPYGGFPKFVSEGHNDAYLPVFLQEAGYNTYYTGKLFNAHTVDNYADPYPRGWTSSDFLLDPYTYQYLNATFQRNRDPPVNHEGEYTTDVLAGKALGLLDEALGSDKPFFLGVGVTAPHAHVDPFPIDLGPGELKARGEAATFMIGGADGKSVMKPPIAAERHKHLFQDVVVPRTENFNPDKESGASWIRQQPKQPEANVAFNDHFYRQRLRALQAVDELVDSVFEKLEAAGILDDTYIFYSADNGYHIGQHRLQPGKECGYEEDVNIPLIVRGPGVPAGQVSEIVTTHTDLLPTFLNLAQADHPSSEFDGVFIPLTEQGLEDAKETRHEHVTVEYWGISLSEGAWGQFGSNETFWITNNTYKSLRVISKEYNLYYSVWCSNEHELYDLNTDPGQLNNLLHPDTKSPSTLLGHSIDTIVSRLDALLFVTKSFSHPRIISGIINNEDDNKAIARRYKSHQARKRNRFSPTKVAEDRELPASLLPSPIPKPRSFKWVAETHHVPAEFQTKKLRGKAPWYLHLRFLMTDLPEQLSEDSSGVKRWRNHAVKGGKVFRRYSLGSNLIWGRRCVFSEREIGYPYWLTGNWLVVAYLWGTNKAWVQQADIRDLVSFDSTYRIRVYEHQYYPFDNAAGWARRYELERKAEGIYHRLFHYQPRPGVVPPPVLPGTTAPYGHSILGDLLNRKVKGLVLASGEKDKGREPSPATNVVIYAPGETPTTPKHGWREMPCMF